MEWYNMKCFVVFSALFVILSAGNPVSLKDGATVNIPLYNYTINASMMVEQLISVSPHSTIALNITDIPSLAGFVLLQTHTYDFNISLSYSKILTQHNYINGTDVGLVQMNENSVMQFFIYNGNSAVVAMLVIIQAYGKYAPIPGGCNMEFSVEIAPYLCLEHTSSLITVDAQLPSVPSIRLTCDDYSALVYVKVYRLYLPERDFSIETYFDAVRKMATVHGIQENGKLISMPRRGSSLRRTFSAYPGTGSVYGVLAFAGGTATAYVPSVTYACGDKNSPEDDMCQVLTAPFSKVLCAMMFFSGLLMCFGGHKFFKMEMFLLGFSIAANISYIVLGIYKTDFNEITLDLFTFFCGLGVGFVWLSFWVCFGIPILPVLLATLSLGYVLASVIMFAGLGDVNFLQWDVNFWAAFLCITIAICVMVSPLMHKANIICCAILGAFAVVTPMDHYIGSNLRFIIANTLRRATVPEFNTAVIDPPFQWKDGLLSGIWIVMSIAGAAFQFLLQQGKPPFPPPLCQRHDDHYTTSRRRGLSLVSGEAATDRTPLLVDAHVTYGVSPDSVFSSPSSSNGTGYSNSRINRLMGAFRINRNNSPNSNK